MSTWLGDRFTEWKQGGMELRVRSGAGASDLAGYVPWPSSGPPLLAPYRRISADWIERGVLPPLGAAYP